MRTRAAIVTIAVVLASAGATTARAQNSSTLRNSLGDEAGSKFDDGVRLYGVAQFAEAREAFLAAYARSGDSRILYNVAVCDKSLGRYARAIQILKKSLAATDRPLNAEYTQKVSETIATLSRYVAYVTINSSVEGTSITVDGEPVREMPVALETGTHTIAFTKEGYDAGSQDVVVTAGQSRTVTLEPQRSTKPGSVRVTCAGLRATEACEIRLGNDVLGVAPVSVERSEGTYLVRAFVGGRRWAEQSVTFHNGTAVEVALAGHLPANGRLRVTTDRFDDVVTLDGHVVGKSGVEVEVPPGEHRILISRHDGASRSMDIVLAENETRDLRVTLEKAGGISPWWFVGGGVVIAGAATLAIVLATSSSRTTRYEGGTAGTLNPYVVPATFTFGGTR